MRSGVTARLRRLARHTAMFAVMCVLLSPAWLGPTVGPIARALGAFEHVCACGMAPGTCGCPACARLERERHEHAPRPVLKSSCDRDEGALPAPPLPPCVLPTLVALRDPAVEDVLLVPPAERALLSVADGPPTPPPRGCRL